MKFLGTIIAALIALFGVALGSWLTYDSSHKLRLEEDLAKYRYEAYRDLIKSQFVDYSDESDLSRLDTKEEFQWDTFRRLAMFSSGNVVRGVVTYIRQIRPDRKACPKPQDKLKDLQMWQAIRTEIHGGMARDHVDDKSLAVVVFPGCTLDIE